MVDSALMREAFFMHPLLVSWLMEPALLIGHACAQRIRVGSAKGVGVSLMLDI